MALILPNSIENDTPADAAELQQNFATVQSYVNTNVLHRDGSVALTAPILLPGDPTQPNHAANKEYVDAGDATAAAATALKVAKAGDTMIGNLTVGATVTAHNFINTTPQYEVPEASTRKDYVDGRDTAVTNAANTRMDAQDAAFQTTTLNAAYARADLKVARTGHETMTGPLTIARTDDPHCLVLKAPNHATPYMSWFHGTSLGAYSQVNFSTGVWDQVLVPDWTMRWFSGGTHVMNLTNDGLVSFRKLNCSYVPSSNSWSTANFIAQSDTGNGSRMAIRHGGTVFQWRMHSSVGQAECLNADATGFIGIRGGAYTNASALSTKKDVRPLREGGDAVNPLIAAELLPSDADTVEAPPDIMALRPIIYRHAVEPQCVKVDDDGEQVGVEPEPVDTVRGQEGRREHIGLIADEVQHVIPSAVVHDADGAVVGIDYAQVTVALLDHVQQLTARLEALENAA